MGEVFQQKSETSDYFIVMISLFSLKDHPQISIIISSVFNEIN